MEIPVKKIEADLAVIGGGMAGVCTAVAAARNGISVILVQDRPMLGGNASSEMRMWICGAKVKEAGILEEIQLENYYLNPTLRYTIWDDVLYTFIKREKNIRLLLNTSVDSVKTENSVIKSVSAWGMNCYTRYEISAKLFADCSGDSILHLSGADFRMGREGRDEFHESHAPEKPDSKTMGNTILIQLRKTDSHRPFIAPEWAYHYTDETISRKECMFNMRNNNFWWMEFGGVRDTIHDADEIRDELMKIAYGCWEYIKNHPDGRAREWELDWIGKLPGKRESIRYLGDYILTQNDVEAEGNFPDAVAHGGWPMDNHPPEAFYYTGPATTYHPAPVIYGIPYRCLYSRNIRNLMFAGRNISCTHMAMSSTRVMGTCAVVGQAVGTAAALAVKYNTDPRGVYTGHIDELRQTLLEQDQFIPFAKRNISALTLNAEISDENLRNGIDRSFGENDNGSYVKLGDACFCKFGKAEKISSIRIIFDSDFSDLKKNRNIEGIPDDDKVRRVPGTIARDFRIEILNGGKWSPLQEIKENRKRCLRLRFDPVSAEGIRLVPLRSWDEKAEKVHLFSFEAE